jgi:ubiquinol-cytochrome c reductase cytochrome c1 subunit
MFTRKALPSDHFNSPFPNDEAAAASNNGAVPPDMSLLAKAREIERGFPQFIFDIFTQYQEGGPDYIYSLLTGYEEPPAGFKVPQNSHYNPYFDAAATFAMPKPLSDGQVTYDDGSPQTVDQYARDVAAFLMWTSEPHLEDRKHLGFMVMVFLLIFSTLIYLTKRSVYAKAGAH